MITTFGPKVLLLGAGGTGKSHALSTLETAGLQVAAIFTEPSGMETLEAITSKERFHWMYVPPAAPDWAMMARAAKTINSLSFKSLTELGDIDKQKFGQWMDFITAHNAFKCQRCGLDIGDVGALGEGWAVANDSLSGMNMMAMNLVTGMKPVKSPGDWGVAMDNLEKYVQMFSTSLPSLGVITAHIEKEPNEITGGTEITVSTLGKKLAPKIGRFFSDVILSRRDGLNFNWSTAAFNVDLKARNVPISDKIEPSFVPIVRKWEERIKASKGNVVPLQGVQK